MQSGDKGVLTLKWEKSVQVQDWPLASFQNEAPAGLSASTARGSTGACCVGSTEQLMPLSRTGVAEGAWWGGVTHQETPWEPSSTLPSPPPPLSAREAP